MWSRAPVLALSRQDSRLMLLSVPRRGRMRLLRGSRSGVSAGRVRAPLRLGGVPGRVRLLRNARTTRLLGGGLSRTWVVDKTWTTLDGRKIPYSQLADDHLLNILSMLRRQAQDRAQKLAAKDGAVLGPRGWRTCRMPAYDSLLAEAHRRGGEIALRQDRLKYFEMLNDYGAPELLDQWLDCEFSE